MCDQMELVTFIEEILNGKPHFFCGNWFGLVQYNILLKQEVLNVFDQN